MAKIVIILEGGLVSSVITDVESEVLICDYDIEGAESEEISFNPYGESAVMHTMDAEVSRTTADNFFRCFWEGGDV